MKKTLGLSLFAIFALTAFAAAQSKEFDDEVVDVDPIGGRVTFKTHGEYFAASPELLKNVNRRDLVQVMVAEEKGGTITKITKTGEAPPPPGGIRVGRAVQDVLVATGEVAKTITTPVPPAHGVVSGAVGATTDATGAVIEDATFPETKQDF